MLQPYEISIGLKEHSNPVTPKAYTPKSPSGPLPPDSDDDEWFLINRYCMLPMVVLLALSLFMPRGGAVIVVLSMVFVTWSARVRNKLLGLVTRWDEHLGLVGYACFLVYSLFSLLVVF
ncbi:hypothetical protein D0Y65_004085 [Glycine soja]|uniref:Uncharacterized protein n=1 Tax=Glycine soja TaxID=3848 RepID=A0A445LPW5_GLYSO|nr:hypothetical protein D0Y65_004085 [Glycine soja]